jgi:hypothetical protein
MTDGVFYLLNPILTLVLSPILKFFFVFLRIGEFRLELLQYLLQSRLDVKGEDRDKNVSCVSLVVKLEGKVKGKVMGAIKAKGKLTSLITILSLATSRVKVPDKGTTKGTDEGKVKSSNFGWLVRTLN